MSQPIASGCLSHAVERGARLARAHTTPASELGVHLLHMALQARGQRWHRAPALITARPSARPVIMACRHSLQSVAVIMTRRSHSMTALSLLVLIMGPSSESGCLCTYKAAGDDVHARDASQHTAGLSYRR